MPSPRSSLSTLITRTVAVLGLLTIIVYATLPLLLGAWLEHLLTEQGFTQVKLTLSRPGLRALRLPEISMTRVLGDHRWVLSAQQLDIEYRILDALAGQIRSLRIPQAQLEILPSLNKNEQASQALAMPVPAQWLRDFPLKELIVKDLRIAWRTDSETGHAQLRGQAQQENGKLHSRWSLDTPNPIELELNIDTGGELSAALYRRNEPAQALVRTHIAITPLANERVAVQGTLQAKLNSLTTLLALTLPKQMRPIDGSLRVTWTGEASTQLTPETGFKGALDIDLTDLRVGALLQAGNLLVRMKLAKTAGSWQWRLQETSRLAGQLNPVLLAVGDAVVDTGFVRGAKPMVIRVPAGLTGELNVAPTEWHFMLNPAKVSIEHVYTPDVQITKLNLSSLRPVHIRYRSSGRWSSDGLHLHLTAPVVQPQLAAFGNIENFALHARIAAGRLNSLPALQIDSVDMLLLSGNVSGRDIQYSRANRRNDFTLEIKGLDLARVVALEQQQQIEASGTLNGKLPFVLTHAGIRIVDGTLHATPAGGVIRYHAPESVQSMAAANPNLKLAVLAFSNYHYQKLDVKVNYAENGDLALGVAMAGRNPDWNSGKQINLNLNLAENIPMLLRSLRSGDDIGAQFQNRLDEQTSSTP